MVDVLGTPHHPDLLHKHCYIPKSSKSILLITKYDRVLEDESHVEIHVLEHMEQQSVDEDLLVVAVFLSS